MAKISAWQKALMKRKVKGEMNKLYKDNSKVMEEIKDRIAEAIENIDERKQLNFVIILCSEIIAGFDEKEHQEFIISMVQETIKNLDADRDWET